MCGFPGRRDVQEAGIPHSHWPRPFLLLPALPPSSGLVLHWLRPPNPALSATKTPPLPRLSFASSQSWFSPVSGGGVVDRLHRQLSFFHFEVPPTLSFFARPVRPSSDIIGNKPRRRRLYARSGGYRLSLSRQNSAWPRRAPCWSLLSEKASVAGLAAPTTCAQHCAPFFTFGIFFCCHLLLLSPLLDVLLGAMGVFLGAMIYSAIKRYISVVFSFFLDPSGNHGRNSLLVDRERQARQKRNKVVDQDRMEALVSSLGVSLQSSSTTREALAEAVLDIT